MSEFQGELVLPSDSYLVAPHDTVDPATLLQQAEAFIFAHGVTGESLLLSGATVVLTKLQELTDPQLNPQLSLRQRICWAEINTADAIKLRFDSSFNDARNAWVDVAAETGDYTDKTQKRVTRTLGSLGRFLVQSGRQTKFEQLWSSLLEDGQQQTPFRALAALALSQASERSLG
jgi:hypothetical protein